MGLAGLVVGSFCLSIVKTSIRQKKSRLFHLLIGVILWLGAMAGAWICVHKLLPAYELPYLIGYGAALILSIF